MDIRTTSAADLAPLIALHDAAFGTLFEGQLVADLMAADLAQARKAGWEAVIVLGHPEFYARFGFRADLAEGFDAPFSGPAFMALELTKSALSNRKGKIIYPAPFGIPAPGDAPTTV